MAKFSGLIGFAELIETKPDVWKEKIVTRKYRGDLIKNTRTLQGTDQVNSNINIANEISIVADPYANMNFHSMRYVEFMGAKWRVSSVDASERPRLKLTLGGLYNGD